jgi:hypothetical protein
MDRFHVTVGCCTAIILSGCSIARGYRVKCSWKFAVGIQLFAIVSLAQSDPHTYVGDIVNANCMQRLR